MLRFRTLSAVLRNWRGSSPHFKQSTINGSLYGFGSWSETTLICSSRVKSEHFLYFDIRTLTSEEQPFISQFITGDCRLSLRRNVKNVLCLTQTWESERPQSVRLVHVIHAQSMNALATFSQLWCAMNGNHHKFGSAHTYLSYML